MSAIRRTSPTERLWYEFCCRLRAFVSSRISGASDVDDIMQEIFLKIHLHIDELKDENSVSSWVYAIARNTLVDAYRKRRRRDVDIGDLQIADEQEEESPAREIAAGLRDMVRELPGKYAEALYLVEFEGVRQTEAAKKLGISVSGAKSRVQRARQMLKDMLMRCCHFQFDRFGSIIEAHPRSCCCCSPAGS